MEGGEKMLLQTRNTRAASSFLPPVFSLIPAGNRPSEEVRAAPGAGDLGLRALPPRIWVPRRTRRTLS